MFFRAVGILESVDFPKLGESSAGTLGVPGSGGFLEIRFSVNDQCEKGNGGPVTRAGTQKKKTLEKTALDHSGVQQCDSISTIK